MKRCLSCQAFLSSEHETEDGLYCPACHDEVPDADLRMNGYKYNGTEWVRTKGNE